MKAQVCDRCLVKTRISRLSEAQVPDDWTELVCKGVRVDLCPMCLQDLRLWLLPKEREK